MDSGKPQIKFFIFLLLWVFTLCNAEELTLKDSERIVVEGLINPVAVNPEKSMEPFKFIVRHNGIFYTCVDLMAITCVTPKQEKNLKRINNNSDR